jgi:nitrate/nitrite transport system permease protein
VKENDMAAHLKLARSGEAPPPPANEVFRLVTPPQLKLPRPVSAFALRAGQIIGAVLPPICGFAGLLLVWSLAAQFSDYLPGPGKTFASAVEVFSHPFYQKGPNDQGVGWNLLASMSRVAKGFGLAAAVGIPLGFILGRFAIMSRAVQPIISVLRPVSPLAWLPIGLAVFKAAGPAAVFTIFICSIWPMIINTALGVASVPQDYLNVARVLKLSEWKVFTKILLPASVPYVLTGAKLALGIAWLSIVASEMLTGGVGIGFWLWDEWNNLNMEHILIAIGVIGVVGLLLEQGMTAIANRFDYRVR